MEAKFVSNQRNKKTKRGERVISSPPKHFGKYAKEEWNRLINNLHIAEEDIGSLIIACQSYETYMDLYDFITTEEYEDKSGRIRKRKISIAQFTAGKTSQNQTEITTMNRALEHYNRIVKRLTTDNKLTGLDADSSREAKKGAEIYSQLFGEKKLPI